MIRKIREDIFIRLVDMPTRIKGMTVVDIDGNYIVYINDRLAYNVRQEVLEHEMTHIAEGHFYDESLSVEQKEGCERRG